MTAVHSQRLPAVVVVVLSLSLAPARAEARAPELTGLGRQKYIKSYVDLGLKALEPKAWAQRSPKERMNAVMAAAQRQLKKIGVPTAKAVQVKLPPSVYGQFVAQDDWQLALNREVLHQDVLSREVAVELLDTVYHEVRHAEQWFRSARLRASLGATAHQIATEFRIPLQVTEHATKNPLHQRGRDAEEARQWYETLAGRHAKYHLRVLSRLKDRREASAKAYHRWRELLHGPQATTEDREQAKKEWHTAQQAYKAAYADYRRLPDEADAFVLGDAVKSECRRRTP